MKSEWMITLLTAGGILILCAAMIIWDKIRQRKWFLRHLKQRWGTVPDREYTQEELESISHYAKRNEGEQFMIDDITWNDLQMDEIFIRINNTLSSCGEDVLYQILRQPQMDRNVLDERERLIAYFQTHEEERIQVLTRVNEVKKIWKMSIADYIDALKDVDRRGRGKYPLLAGLSAAAIVATLIRPIPCMFLLLLMLCVSAVVHTRDSKRIEPYLNCFVCILRLLRAADQFEKLDGVKVLLCHKPEHYIKYLRTRALDLVVAGHAHGGQIRVAGRGVFSPGQGLFPRYTYGVVDGRMVISAGAGNPVHLPRWGNPCEVLRITLD